jgi:capsular polysaccharide export protein
LILVKVHPDVAVGNRQETPHFQRIQQLADVLLTEGSILQCIEVADEVHTLTSLAGFEALLHGKKVVTYGNPFYGGWGLTEDHSPFARRHRTLTLEELAAAVLLNYAQYYSTRYKCPAPPECIVDELEVDRLENPQSAPNLLKLRRNLFRQFKKKQKQF